MSAPPQKRNPIPFGTYLLLDRINIGGMAEVWRGKSFGAGGFERLVAIKRILPNIAEEPDFKSMFIDEAKLSVLLAHANIAQTYELGELHQSLYIAMEYVAGKDLRVVFDRARKQKTPLPIPLVCHVMLKASEGLDHAHRKKDQSGRELNIVHRDVSPQNILLSYDGEVKVIDFGIAKASSKATTTQAGVLKGKFGYMSPEQILGAELDRRSDIFALGVCLRELLTGERLFVGNSDYSVLEKVRNVDLRSTSGIEHELPPELDRIVLRALAKRPEDRYQYASDLAEDLERYLVSNGHFFGRRDLMEYMRSAFAGDVEKEAARQLEYAGVEATPEILASIESDRESPAVVARVPSSLPQPRSEPAPRPPEDKTTVGHRRGARETPAPDGDGESTAISPWPKDPAAAATKPGEGRRTDAALTPVLGVSAVAPARSDDEDTTGASSSRPSARATDASSKAISERPTRNDLVATPVPRAEPGETLGMPARLANRLAPMLDEEAATLALPSLLDPDATVGPAHFELPDEPTPVSRHRSELRADDALDEDALDDDALDAEDGEDDHEVTDHGAAGVSAPETYQRPRRLAPLPRRGEQPRSLAALFDAKARLYSRRDLWLAGGVGALAMLALWVLMSVISGSGRSGTVVVEVLGVPAPMTSIRVGGRLLPTPAQFPLRTEAPLGTVEIELGAAGYRSSRHVVTLDAPGAVAEVRAQLEPLPR